MKIDATEIKNGTYFTTDKFHKSPAIVVYCGHDFIQKNVNH